MSTDQEKVAPQEQVGTDSRPRRPLQFSLFSMLVVTFAVAVICSLTFSIPAVVAFPLFLLFSVMLAAVLTTVVIYGRGYQRTFCIGALFPAGLFLLVLFPFGGLGMVFSTVSTTGNSDEFWLRLIVVGFWASSILTGAVCVGVRKLVERRPDAPQRPERLGSSSDA